MTDTTLMASGALMVGVPGTELDADTEERLRALRPAGMILFGRNLKTPEQTVRLIESLARLPCPPRLLAIDQEGGAVSRLRPFIGATPTAADLSYRGASSVDRFAGLTGRVLSALGFNLNFAPVVDLCHPGAGNGIDDRAFGDDPDHVVELAGLYLDALQGAGVAGCLKHFPGLGSTSVDSHVELPTAQRTLEELEAFELRPYRELGRRAACVMVGHGHYPALNPGEARPATGSATIIRGILRERLGYRGLVCSDDMLMGAVAALDDDGAFAVESLAAGCDLLLYCKDLDRAVTAVGALTAEAAVNPFIRRRLAEAGAAVEQVSQQYPSAPPSLSEWQRARVAIADFDTGV